MRSKRPQTYMREKVHGDIAQKRSLTLNLEDDHDKL